MSENNQGSEPEENDDEDNNFSDMEIDEGALDDENMNENVIDEEFDRPDKVVEGICFIFYLQYKFLYTFYLN